MSVQGVALTCKTEELDQVKGIVYITANLTAAKYQLSQLRLWLNVHTLLSREKISVCQEWQNTHRLLTTKP